MIRRRRETPKMHLEAENQESTRQSRQGSGILLEEYLGRFVTLDLGKSNLELLLGYI